eukprot:2677587-Pyramimonas_sp.AAC.2
MISVVGTQAELFSITSNNHLLEDQTLFGSQCTHRWQGPERVVGVRARRKRPTRGSVGGCRRSAAH